MKKQYYIPKYIQQDRKFNIIQTIREFGEFKVFLNKTQQLKHFEILIQYCIETKQKNRIIRILKREKMKIELEIRKNKSVQKRILNFFKKQWKLFF